jgi:RNA polymerase sigma-70 factor (ECF subfamily)
MAIRSSSSLSESIEAASAEWLAASARDGGDGAIACFSELLRRYEPRVHSFVLRRLAGSSTDAQDVTQETFLRAWRSLARYDDSRRFGAWLFTLAARAASDHRRAAGRRVRRERVAIRNREEPETQASDASPRVMDDQAIGAALWKLAQQELSEDAYATLWLRCAEGLSPAEIASALGRSGVWVRVTLFRARAALAETAAQRGLVASSTSDHSQREGATA